MVLQYKPRRLSNTFSSWKFFEFIVPLEGWFEVEVEGKNYHLEERDILVIPAWKTSQPEADKISGRTDYFYGEHGFYVPV